MPPAAFRPLRLIKSPALLNSQQPESADLALLADVRAGKAFAAAAFHDRVRPIVDRTLGRLLGAGDSDRDDLAQQALIELVLSVERFRGDCPLDAWATVVSARVVYKHLRRRKIERRLFVLDSHEALERPDRAATNAALWRSSVRHVESHLRAMNGDRAWAFVLHEVHGFSLKEISDIMKASLAAVQSRLVRGRRELEQRIAADGELAELLMDLEHVPRGGHDE
jgi:RNA polymerase sigma-70 factor, ECF subfamily